MGKQLSLVSSMGAAGHRQVPRPHRCTCMGLQARVATVAGLQGVPTFMFSATRPVSMLMAPNSFSMTQIFLPWSCEQW